MKYKQTVNCVRCGKPAVLWSAHVLRDSKKISAGWCSDECRNTPGFVGHYKKWMGREDA